MKVLDVRAFDGPSVHSPYPVIEMLLDLETLEGRTTNTVDGFVDRLLTALPGLAGHHCSRGRPGGFVERLREGTYFGHTVEHTAIEMQCQAGMDVIYGKTRWTGTGGIYRVVFEYLTREAGELAGRHAVELVDGLLSGRTVDAAALVAAIRQQHARHGLGPSTAAIADAARRRNIPVMRIGNDSLLQLGYGARARRVRATVTDATSCLAVDIAGDKALAKELLSSSGIPVPAGGLATTLEAALKIAADVGYPVVAKPVDGNQGKGVALDIRTPEDLRLAYEVARSLSDRVIVERYIRGHHYRVVVVGERVVAASERLPAQVCGDGTHTVEELVAAVNADPLRGEDHERPLTRIKIDQVAELVLAKQRLTAKSVPVQGEVVLLRENCNLSTGGTAVDVTDRVHPENRDIALRIARLVGLDVCGIDLVVDDISRPLTEANGAVIEVNAAPGIRMHHYPSAGRAREVAGAIVDHIFPDGSDGRIPIIAVTGTNGKTTVTRMIARMLAQRGIRVGASTTDGVLIGGRLVWPGDNTGPRSARMILRDPTVEAAVLETARGGIVRGGLAFDWCDVAVLTNITGDHLGQDGINTMEDLADVKAVVLESVKPEGYAVINADDQYACSVASRTKGRVIYFSVNEDSIQVHRHLQDGGRAVTIKNGAIVYSHRGRDSAIVDVRSIPCTFHGRMQHNTENALAAAAAGVALGLDNATIRQALQSFTANERDNPGRFNIHRVRDFNVIIDYGHNPAGIAATARAARQLTKGQLIGVIAAPGDRSDETLLEVGRAAGQGFNRIYLKEDHDRRGRLPGQVASLLRRGAIEAGLAEDAAEVILDEDEAIRAALATARAGDTVVVFYEKYDQVMAALAMAIKDLDCLAAEFGATGTAVEVTGGE
ncbi:MAG: cyanophycin synthetase [Chloroflexota bacterium]